MSGTALKHKWGLPDAVNMPSGAPDAGEEAEPPGTAPAHWSFGTTADVGIGARASTPAELFHELGLALFDLITDVTKVRAKEVRAFTVAAPTPEGLVVRYLTELLVAQDVDDWLFSRFDVEVEGLPPVGLKVRAHGERFDETRHPRKVAVKAATLHRLQIDLSPPRARVILDI